MESHCQLWNVVVNLTAKSVLKNELHGGAVARGGEGISRGSDNVVPNWLGKRDWKQSKKTITRGARVDWLCWRSRGSR